MIEAVQTEKNSGKSKAEKDSSNSSSSATGEQQPQRVLPVDSKADLCVEKAQLPRDPSTFLSEMGESSQQKFKKTLEKDAENEQCPVFGPKLPPPSRSSSSSSGLSGGGGGGGPSPASHSGTVVSSVLP